MQKVLHLPAEYANLGYRFVFDLDTCQTPYVTEEHTVEDLPDYCLVKVVPVDYHDRLPFDMYLPREEFVDMIRALSHNNFRVAAVKMVRTATDWGLKEAYDFVVSL